MAGRASLSFLGQEDISLSGDPQVTYFIERYVGQTLFAQRVDQVIFDEQAVFFGGENHRILPRSGDLITNMYLYIQFPVLPTNYGVLDSVGTLMFQYVELYLGTELIERLYGEHIEMKYDLEVPQGKQPGLTYMIGKILQFSVIPQLAYTIPLNFSTFKKGLAVDGADITFRIVWNPSTFFTFPAYSIPGTITSHLNVEYTYISDLEKKKMNDGSRFQVFEQVQRMEFFAPHGVSNVQCLLDFYNPVKELFVVLQNDSALGYDYSNTATSTSTTLGTMDLLGNLELDFNGVSRIEPRVGTPQFLRIIQPLEFHTRVPDRLFYMYSFSLDPESYFPCGSVNLSRIKNQNLYISLNPTQTNVKIRIYVSSYNFLEGGKVIFSNFN
jgi:Large eukaryotic DNA virus major capsid protein/Major capsid protein N-terminus